MPAGAPAAIPRPYHSIGEFRTCSPNFCTHTTSYLCNVQTRNSSSCTLLWMQALCEPRCCVCAWRWPCCLLPTRTPRCASGQWTLTRRSSSRCWAQLTTYVMCRVTVVCVCCVCVLVHVCVRVLVCTVRVRVECSGCLSQISQNTAI